MHSFPVPDNARALTKAEFAFSWRRSVAVIVDGARVTPTLACCVDTWNRIQAGETITEVVATEANIAVYPDPDGSQLRAFMEAVEVEGADIQLLDREFTEKMVGRRARARAAILG